MIRAIVKGAGGALVVIGLLAAPAAAAPQDNAGSLQEARIAAAGEAGPTDHVVLLRPDVTMPGSATAKLARAHGFEVAFAYTSAIRGFAAPLTSEQVERLRRESSVKSVVPDTDFRAAGKKVSETLPINGEIPAGVTRIGAEDARRGLEAASSAVAVLDTGLDLANPDLDAEPGVNCIKTAKSSQDDNGHGTHVGGTIGAHRDGHNVAGVAPGTRLYSVKVLDKQAGGRLSTLLCGIDWVHANAARLNIRVANMSLTAPGYDDGACGSDNGDVLHAAICASVSAGILYVAAAGNSSVDMASTVPASYAETLAATAMSDSNGQPGGGGADACGEADDAFATFSNFAGGGTNPSGQRDADHLLSAPGGCVVSTGLGGGVSTMQGTSMAAPHLAAAAAVCIGRPGTPGRCAGLRPLELIQRLRADAEAVWDTHGFAGDPGRTGHLVSASSY